MRPDPVPAAIRTELQRLGERWQTLPLDRALQHAPVLRDLARRCDPDPSPAHLRDPLVQDLGPECAYDQVTALVYDLCRHRAAHPTPDWEALLLADLVATRHAVG